MSCAHMIFERDHDARPNLAARSTAVVTYFR
jgi:hypothetical protein